MGSKERSIMGMLRKWFRRKIDRMIEKSFQRQADRLFYKHHVVRDGTRMNDK